MDVDPILRDLLKETLVRLKETTESLEKTVRQVGSIVDRIGNDPAQAAAAPKSAEIKPPVSRMFGRSENPPPGSTYKPGE